ncbi:MAG: IS30 family transposase, partial [Bacteroidales bacterium]|nr:IS30 family transposase [Bacteroidales bacterium]
RLLKPFKKHVLSITTDNGGEFARHKLVSKALNAPVFFTDPYSSWQKATIENTNDKKLLLPLLAKGVISCITQESRKPV